MIRAIGRIGSIAGQHVAKDALGTRTHGRIAHRLDGLCARAGIAGELIRLPHDVADGLAADVRTIADDMRHAGHAVVTLACRFCNDSVDRIVPIALRHSCGQ
ncbi:hypothetical protein D3C87_1242630 [compost metagenome]